MATIPTIESGFSASSRVAIGLIVAAMVAVLGIAASRGDDERGHWFDLYASDLGAPLTEMKRSVSMGPFESEQQCYAVGVLGIMSLNNKFADRQFMGRCDDGDLLTIDQLYERATANPQGERK